MGIPLKPARPKPGLKLLSSVTPRQIDWLWYPYIPAGTVTAIFGRGGQGKSYMTADIAARISRGDPLPGQEGQKPPQKILMLSAEDDYETVLVPRLIKIGANLDNIAVPSFQFTLDKWGAEQVAELMREFTATIVFIDPIVYYAGGKMDMNKSNEVRAMMESLKTAAEQSNSSVVIVGHIKKSEEGADQDRMMGSADWVNAARSGVLVTKTNDGTSIVKHVKTNYGAMGQARSFLIDDFGFHWGEVYEDDDLPASTSSKKKDKAVIWLKDYLANGPVPADEVELAAMDNDITRATLNRAKKGVAESYYNKEKKIFMWRLETDGALAAARGED